MGASQAALASLRTTRRRVRGLRWLAAAAAALCAFAVLSSAAAPDLAQQADQARQSDTSPQSDPPAEAAAGGVSGSGYGTEPALLLPPASRGVVVPVQSPVFTVGALVDVHEVRSSTLIVAAAGVVGSIENEVLIAVEPQQVSAVVDALTTGGVVLVLVAP